MLRRISRAMNEMKDHAAAARELSTGLYEAIASVVRVHADFEAIMAAHERQIERQLPGF